MINSLLEKLLRISGKSKKDYVSITILKFSTKVNHGHNWRKLYFET